MRQEVEFRFYEGRSEGPQRPERNTPSLLQGGGEALMFGDSVRQG
jgi:hypothetical protein